MKLVVGLGNPGAKYAANRHNIGFMALDQIASDHGFSPWKSAFKGLVSEGRLGSEKVILLKPSTFMNLSGEAVRAALDWHKLTVEDVIVLHDELDLAPGKLRLKQGGGHAGHNGLRSIHAHIGENYARLRLGIGHPGHKDAVANYVLHDFSKADQLWLSDLLWGISDGAEALVKGDGAKFTNTVAVRMGALEKPAKAPKAPREPAEAKPEVKPAEKSAPAAVTPEPDTRSALERLADRFRGQ